MGVMSTTDDAKQMAWREHYERLLNVEFDWDADHLSDEPLLEGPPIPFSLDHMVKNAIAKMSSGKATGPSGIVAEMTTAAGDKATTLICDLATSIIKDGKVPVEWEESFIVGLYKGKGCFRQRQLSWAKANRTSHESPGAHCRQRHLLNGLHRRLPVWLHSW